MKPNNILYREIAEKVTGKEYPKFYSSLYYMRETAEQLGAYYDGRKPSNKYLKDIHTIITGNTPTTHKYNLYYLRALAKYYVPSSEPDLTENQCLQIIKDNIETTTSVKLSLVSSRVVIDTEVVLTATVLDENRDPISNVSVDFEADGESIGSATTGSDGKATIPYDADTLGDIMLTATYDEYVGYATLTVTKHTTSLSIGATTTVIYVGQTATVTGTLLIDGIGASGKRVEIYDGDTNIGFTTSSTNGAYTYTTDATTTDDNMNIKAVYDTDDKYIGSESDTVGFTVYKNPTSLSIETPTLVYSDAFSVTGALSSGGTPIPNATVRLVWYDGETAHHVDGTTNSSGQVTFSRDAPTTITTYSFYLRYTGTNAYKDSTSTSINVAVNKESSVLNITSPQNGDSVNDSDSITVTGTLKDNDDTAMANKTVYAKISNTTIASFTTDTDGEISGTISANLLQNGDNNIVFGFDEDETYTACELNAITVSKGSTYSNITVSAEKNILSYADTESTDLYAQLNQAVSGVWITFNRVTVDGTFIEELGLAQTDSTGKATLIDGYESEGTGDVYVKATDGNFVSEIFVVQDLFKYIASGSQTFSATSYNIFNIADINGLSGDYEISVTLKSSAQNGFGMALNVDSGTQNKNLFRIGYNGSNQANIFRMANGGSGETYVDTSKTYSPNTDTVLKLTKVNGVYTGYIDSYSHSFNNYPSPLRYVQLESWSTNKTLNYADFKVKPL